MTVQLKESIDKGPESVGPSGMEEIDFAPLVDYFGMDRPMMDEKDDLRYIHGWMAAEGNRSRGDMLSALKNLEIRLGAPPTGENRIKRIVNYLKIDAQIADLLKEQSAYLN